MPGVGSECPFDGQQPLFLFTLRRHLLKFPIYMTDTVSLFLPVKMWQGPSKAMFLIRIDLNSLFQPLLQHDDVDGVDNTHHLFEHYPVVDEGLRDVH